MALGKFSVYGGDGIAYVLRKGEAVSVYTDGFLYYLFDVDRYIIGFIVYYDNQIERNLDSWFETLISSRHGNSDISFLQKPIVNNENTHNIHKDLIHEYNNNLKEMQLAHMIDLDDRKTIL